MKTFILISSLSLTTLFIALPIEDHQDVGDRPDNRAPINDDFPDNEPAPKIPQSHSPTVDSKIDDFFPPKIADQLAIPEDRFYRTVALCTNFCQLVQECSDRGGSVPTDGGFSSGNDQLRGNIPPEVQPASEHAIVKLATTTSPNCIGKPKHYDITNEELLKSASLCAEQGLQQLSSKKGSSIVLGAGGENCCANCVTKMNSQYGLAPECGEKFDRLVLCLTSSRRCPALQGYFGADRKRVRDEDDPDYPCRECVEAFEYSCGKG